MLLSSVDAAGVLNSNNVFPEPCVVFCGPGAQRCRRGTLRSWSLHSELPGKIELCIWRRVSVNIVVKVASFKVNDVIKGRQTVPVPSTPVQVGLPYCT